MTKSKYYFRWLFPSVAMVLLGGCNQSTLPEVPSSASYSQNIYHEAGFAAMDGHILKVFTLGPDDLLSWKSEVESYTAMSWEKCPADGQLMEFLLGFPPEMLEPSGGMYIVEHLEKDQSAEVFYISASGECWWFERW